MNLNELTSKREEDSSSSHVTPLVGRGLSLSRREAPKKTVDVSVCKNTSILLVQRK